MWVVARRVIESLYRTWGQGSRLYGTMRSSMRQGPLARTLPPLEPTFHVRAHLTYDIGSYQFLSIGTI